MTVEGEDVKGVTGDPFEGFVFVKGEHTGNFGFYEPSSDAVVD